MSRLFPLLGILVTTAVMVLTGCHPQQPFYFHEDGDLSHYLGVATDIEYPDVQQESLAEVDGALRPFSLQNPEPKETWDLTLEEAIHYALANNKVMRSLGATVSFFPGTFSREQFLRAPVSLTQAPEAMPTIYDPAIVETNPRFGVEAALAAFDTQFMTSMFWEKNGTPMNVAGFFEAFRPRVFRQELGTFQARLAKVAATGAMWSLTHNVRYEQNNTPVFDPITQSGSRRWASDWNVDLEAEMRQPLLQGAGVQFNRIAGPGAIPGFNNGVMIARINTDIALADFEAGVRDLVMDVEKAYWGVYVAYRELDAMIAGRDSALQTWRKVHNLYEIGQRGGEADKEAQAREQYFLFRSQVEQSLTSLYSVESNLRYLMGLTPTDGRLIRPADEPSTAKVIFDWFDVLPEGLARNAELRRQKWNVKRRELELISAKNYLLPRLDAVGRYRWLGLGDDLIDSEGGTGNPAMIGSNAYQSMTLGTFQEWQLGLELSLPIGFRKEMSGVRHAQLNLARERARLQEQELELTHQLSQFIRDLEGGFVLSQTNFNRRVAAQRQVEAVEAAYETDMVTLDLLLDAQRRLAQAEVDYYRSLVAYNAAIAGVHFRKGSLLEYNGIHLSEGPWPGKAYFDAHRRARARDASFYLDYGFTRPKVISRGAYEQQAGGGAGLLEGEIEAGEMDEAGEAVPEPIPTPAPEPIGSPLEPSMPEPAVPEPAAPDADRQASGPEIGMSQAAGGQLAAKKAEAENANKASVLASLKLDNPTGRPSGKRSPAAGRWSAVERASYKEPVRHPGTDDPKRTKTKAAHLNWSDSKSSGTRHEAVANPPAAETDRSPTGWKRVQR